LSTIAAVVNNLPLY